MLSAINPETAALRLMEKSGQDMGESHDEDMDDLELETTEAEE